MPFMFFEVHIEVQYELVEGMKERKKKKKKNPKTF